MLKKGKVNRVFPESIAEEVGIEPGDELLKVNGEPVLDYIDYKYKISEEHVDVTIKKPDGEIFVVEIEKDYDEDLGIEFENPLMDKPKTCTNKCIFCFIDQMPKNMRRSLYFKDDDYRMSFAQGNFVTLTNIDEKDLNRIIKQRLSPLYVSVHTTDMQLRKKMMGNEKAGELMNYLKRLVESKIEIHCQIVLCPDINDGENLDKTINDLAKFWPQVKSVAVVPVGLTKYRQRLFKLLPFNKKRARYVVEQVSSWQNKIKKQIGYTFVFLADEFYLQADMDFPPLESYEDFPQIENGVGLVAVFTNEFMNIKKKLPKKISRKKEVSIATGVLAESVLRPVVNEFNKVDNLKVNLYPIINYFFGTQITVSGLITAEDLISQLKGKPLGEKLLIPETMIKEGDSRFLDNLTIKEVEETLKTPLKIVEISAEELAKNVLD
ncbi:MAG: hypothetical protein PWQ82_678 [Thermosediminibacterales bacterium]|nr:hypothetical protein [Thermosediminibacterales bacterium]